jgi:hypothetical protein
MAIPGSGAISMSMFNTELGRTSNTANSSLAGGTTPAVGSLFWLANQSGSLNQTAPHAMSEWYGYSATPTPLVLYNFASGQSWDGTGTTAVNLGSGGSTYNAPISGSPSYSSGTCTLPEICGAFDSGGSTGRILVPGTSTLYSSNFTWIVYHYPNINGTGIYGVMWSEAGTKNFLWTYGNVGNYTSPTAPTYTRLDTPSTVYQSPDVGTQSNGWGGVGGYIQVYATASAAVLVKNGTSFIQYYYSSLGQFGASLKKVWEVTISDWSIGNTSQALTIGGRNDGSFVMDQYLYGAAIYTTNLSEAQITNVVENFGNELYSCC